MKLSERLFELRRKAGLSQEELADKIGVSRQAVGKWENGASVPELDKLLALSEFYGVPIGELIGVESPAESSSKDPETQAALAFDTGELEELLRGLGEQQKCAEQRAKKQRKVIWCALGAAVAAIVAVALVLGIRMADMDRKLSNLNGLVVFTHNSLNNNIATMWNSIEGLLEWQNSLFSDWSADTVDFDPESREITVELTATPKTVTEGMTAEFTIWAGDGSGEYTVAATPEGDSFVARVRIPVAASYSQWLESALAEPRSAEASGDEPAVDYGIPANEQDFVLTVVLDDGETKNQQELGTFYAGIRQLSGEYSFEWYADTASAQSPAGLLALRPDRDRQIVSAQLITLVNGAETGRRTLEVDGGENWYESFPMPEKYLHRGLTAPDGASVSMPATLSAYGTDIFVLELTLDVPEHGEQDRVSLLLELTDDRGVTYAGIIPSVAADGPTSSLTAVVK